MKKVTIELEYEYEDLESAVRRLGEYLSEEPMILSSLNRIERGAYHITAQWNDPDDQEVYRIRMINVQEQWNQMKLEEKVEWLKENK